MTRSLLSRIPSGALASGALSIANDHVRDHPFSLHSMPSRIGSSACFFSCVFWVCLLQAGAHWSAGSVSFFRRRSSRTPRACVSGSPFSVCVEREVSPLHFFSPQLGPVNWHDIFHFCVREKKRRKNCTPGAERRTTPAKPFANKLNS